MSNAHKAEAQALLKKYGKGRRRGWQARLARKMETSPATISALFHGSEPVGTKRLEALRAAVVKPAPTLALVDAPAICEAEVAAEAQALTDALFAPVTMFAVDREIAAMQSIANVLRPLTPDERASVVSWTASRYGGGAA